MDRKTQRTEQIVAASILLCSGLIIYLGVVPTVVARHYFEKFNSELTALDSSLNGIAASASNPAFNDPDLTAGQQQTQFSQLAQKVQHTQRQLKNFSHTNQLTEIPGPGFADDYRTASVRHDQAKNIAQQSSHVLSEYALLLQYLRTYTGLQNELAGHLQSVNNIKDFDQLKGKGKRMHNTAEHLRHDQKILESLMPPADFAQLQTESLASFRQAADGFTNLGRALNRGIDAEIYKAIRGLEQTTTKSQVRDKNLLVSLADNSPILLQVAELPEKLEYAQGR